MSTVTASKTLELSDWDGIRAKLDRVGHRYGRAKVGNNLYAYEIGDGITFELHGSRIVHIHDNGMVEFSFAGWPTKITADAIEGILGKASIEVRSEWDPLFHYRLKVVTFSGNFYLGFAGRNRRRNEEESIEVNVRTPQSHGFHGETVAKLTGNDLHTWHKITDFVPNWMELVK